MASADESQGIALNNFLRGARNQEEDVEAQNVPADNCQEVRRDTFASSSTGASSATLNGESTLEPTLTWCVEEEAIHGYPKLGEIVGCRDNYAIYRSFKALNARNLLYQQAKVTYLEHELNDLEKRYEEQTHLHWRAEHLIRIQEPGSPGQKLRDKHEEIDVELTKFNHMLLEQARIHELASPDPTFVDSLWCMINSPKKPTWMEHPENAAYAIDDDTRLPIQKDLVTLNRAFRQQDPFTRFFVGTVMSWWHWIYSKCKPPDDDLDFYVYGDHAVSRYMRACVMIIAAALPTCSIIALYFIQSEVWRLLFIVLFSGVFAAALSFFTEAKSIDVFTASVALASVQVVFVGTAFGNGSSTST